MMWELIVWMNKMRIMMAAAIDMSSMEVSCLEIAKLIR